MIKFEEVSKIYQNGNKKIYALNKVSFTINKGEFVIILGPSGAGKSTLIKTILDLKEKKAGKILFSENLKKSEIGYLPQQTVVQKDFPATVYEVVLLARALCASDKIILLDEPVTGLDPQVTQEFYGLLKSLNEQGMTIVMVSHDLSVLKYATHVLYLKKKVPIFMEKEMFIERYGKEIYND